MKIQTHVRTYVNTYNIICVHIHLPKSIFIFVLIYFHFSRLYMYVYIKYVRFMIEDRRDVPSFIGGILTHMYAVRGFSIRLYLCMN